MNTRSVASSPTQQRRLRRVGDPCPRTSWPCCASSGSRHIDPMQYVKRLVKAPGTVGNVPCSLPTTIGTSGRRPHPARPPRRPHHTHPTRHSIVQLGARTPAMLAMSRLSLQALSGGRFVLPISTNPPGDGELARRPRRLARSPRPGHDRDHPGHQRRPRLEYHTQIYQLPSPDNEGRAILSPTPPTHIPIYVASLGPTNPGLAGEVATDGSATRSSPRSPIRSSTSSRRRRGRRPHAGRSGPHLTGGVGVEFTGEVEAAGRHHAEGHGGPRAESWHVGAG